MDLPRAFKIPLRAPEVLRHHAEIDVVRSEHIADLPQHLLNTYIAACVARPIVAGKEQLQFFACGPSLAETQHPAKAPDLDQRTNPGNKEEVGHALAPPATAIFSESALSGQGLAG